MIKNTKKIFLSLFCIALFVLIFPATLAPKAEAALYFVVSYNVDGNFNVVEMQEKEVDEPLTLRPDIPEKEGHRFVGWNTRANGTGYDYAPGSEYIRNESVTLYAQWIRVVDNSTTASVIMHYGKTASTEIPDFELEPSTPFKDQDNTKTKIDTYSWEFWKYNSSTGAFEKESYSTTNEITKYALNDDGTVEGVGGYMAKLLFTPQNKKGLKDTLTVDGKDTGFTTRSGYGFSANGYVNISKEIASGTGTISGTLRASMLYPEYKYAKYYATNDKEFNDMLVTEVKNTNETLTYSLSLRESLLDGEPDTAKVHYTPMWYPNSTSTKTYAPITQIRGLWCPIGEVRYDLKQSYVDDGTFRLNTYSINGSLFDDMYTTHEEYRKDNAS